MKKKVSVLSLMILAVLTLAGCWNGEVLVETTFEMDGSGERIYQLRVMDDTLSDDPILNPDDPDQNKDTGPVINDKHIEGGLPAIQTWLEANAPNFMNVEEMEVDGYMRYYTLSFTFDDFDDFLDKMEQLVNLSPVMGWEDFDADEYPSFECEGALTKECTFTESRVIVEASMDWAIDGIWNDIYDADDLAGFVEKADIATLADYRVNIGEETYEELGHYDPDAEYPESEEYDGRMVYVTSDTFSLSAEALNTPVIIGIVAGVIIVIGGIVGFVVMKKN